MAKQTEKKKRKNPALVYCTGCGAPAEFDVVHQNYHCSYCGADMAINTPVQEKKAWRQAKQEEFLKHMDSLNMVVYECPNCAAKVAVETKEALAKCPFCVSQLVRREFLTSDVFPEMVVPFYITRKEALGFLQRWGAEHPDTKEADLIRKQGKQLSGYYLPYQLVKGPVDCRVTRDNTDRAYHCGGYVNSIAINTSKQLNNLVLDGMEPFDWEAVQGFDFAYLAGQRVKLQDVTVKELNKRVDREVQKNYLPVVEKTMQTQGVKMKADASNMLVMPVLLPAYILQAGTFTAVVNGQTGRVAVAALDIKKDRTYLREPAIITIGSFMILFAIMRVLIGYPPEGSCLLAGVGALIIGIIAFTALTDRRRAKITREIFTSKVQKLRRHQEKLVAENFVERTPLVPVFFEKIRDVIEPVNISFYSPGRWLQWSIAAVILIALPLILGYIFHGFEADNMAWYGAVPWWFLVAFSLPMLFMRFGRVVVYDYPILKKIKEDGSLENIPAKEYSDFSFKRLVKIAVNQEARKFTLGMLVFLLICSLVVAFGD